MTDHLQPGSTPDPQKAYLVTFKIINEAECVIYADTAKQALELFDAGEGRPQVTGVDYRSGRPKVRRLPREDGLKNDW